MKVDQVMRREELLSLPMEDFFRYFESNLEEGVDLEYLTELFTDQPYKETRPYLTRRLLMPVDERFEEIEIVYDPQKNRHVNAIVWYFKITLKKLVELFGKSTLQYEPYSESVVFLFQSKNPHVDVIKTRCSASKNLFKLKGGGLINATSAGEILDTEFEFLQINLR